MSITFVNHCTTNEKIFDNLFLFSDVSIPKTISLIDFIITEVTKTRLDYSALEFSFETISSITDVLPQYVGKSWDIIKKHILNFPLNPLDYSSIQNELDKVIDNKTQIPQILNALKRLHEISKHALESNINALQQDEDKKIGLIGEIFSYLYARDIQKAACLYHKLIPDNPNSSRQGLDLLTVVFKDNPENDEVHFWEAKGTKNNFDGQRYKIVNWFNQDDDTYITMAMEAAKMQWRLEFPANYKRALVALAKYQVGSGAFRYVGSITCDLQLTVANDAIKKFNDIKVGIDNKHFVIFKTEKLLEIVKTVYDKICKI